MALHLSPRIQSRITEMLANGDYPDADAMLDEALELLAERERFLELKRLMAVSVEQAERGELIPYDEAFREEAKRSVMRRFAEGDVPSPDVCP